MLSLMFQKKDIYIFIIADIFKDWNELAWLTSYQRKHRGKVIKFWLMGKTFSDKKFLQTIFSRFLFIHWNVWFFNYFAFMHYDIRMKLRCQYVLKSLTLSRRRPLSYRNQSTDLRSKSMDWFLYDNSLRLEGLRVGLVANTIEVTFDYHLLRGPYAILEHARFHCLVLLAKYT